MFVTNHVLSGVLIGRVLEGRPVTAFVVGVGSHLLLDAVPHWGCDKSSVEDLERLLTVSRRDGILGLATMAAVALVVDRRARPAAVAAMAGAAFLDLDKPIQHFFGVYPFPGAVRRIHAWVQNESTDGLRKEMAYGTGFVVADALVARSSRRRNRAEPPEGVEGRGHVAGRRTYATGPGPAGCHGASSSIEWSVIRPTRA